MAIFDSTARRQLPAEPTYRAPPHNIEAEQALLGAILVNNEAFYRVSDFLEPKHFLEGIHQRIFEITGGLIRAGKLATPVTLKTFLPVDLDDALLGVQALLDAHVGRSRKESDPVASTASVSSSSAAMNVTAGSCSTRVR